jgi:acid phosphatase
MFVRGFLGTNSDTLGTIITVNSTGSPEALGDSLSPSDLCPAFVDGNGGTYATTWDSIYLPPITARLNALLTGNLTFTTSDVSNFPIFAVSRARSLDTYRHGVEFSPMTS